MITWYDIAPCPKPRMTQSDKWKKRPCVLRYWAFCDACRAQIKTLPDTPFFVFGVKMPLTWGGEVRATMLGRPHQIKPDVDNFIKSMDWIGQDQHIWAVAGIKIWTDQPIMGVADFSEFNFDRKKLQEIIEQINTLNEQREKYEKIPKKAGSY